MVDYRTANRIIAVGGILTALDYPVDTWDEAYAVVARDPQPDSLAEVGVIVEKLREARPRIVAASLAEADGGLLVEPTPAADAVTVEQVSGTPKGTRTRA